MDIHEFISGRNHRNTGFTRHRHRGFSHSGQQAQIGQADASPRLQNLIARVRFSSAPEQAFVFACAFQNANGSRGNPFGVFHHHDGISAWGQRRSGHDFTALPRLDRDLSPRAGARLADDRERDRYLFHIFEANSETVTGGFIESGRVGIGENIFAKDAVHAFDERHTLGWHPIRAIFRLRSGQNDLQTTLNW